MFLRMSRSLPLALCLLLLVFSHSLFAQSWQHFAPIADRVGDQPLNTQGLHLQLPLVSDDGAAVEVSVHFDGQLQAEETLDWIHLFASANPYPDLIRFNLQSPRLAPHFTSRIRLNESQRVYALARSSEGRFWLTTRDVRVTVSGCLMRSDAEAQPSMQQPRIALPRRVSMDQLVDIRTLINHPMETGLRRDAQDQLIEQNLVEHLQVSVDNTPLLQVDFFTGTAANPYVVFRWKAQSQTALHFEWQDQQGAKVIENRPL